MQRKMHCEKTTVSVLNMDTTSGVPTDGEWSFSKCVAVGASTTHFGSKVSVIPV
jgi:hypothetical protein